MPNEKKYPFLFSLVNEFEKHKVYITTSWVKRDNCRDIFLKRKISAKKFRDGYGIPILEYFIAVIDEQKPLGDCPIMSKFVRYLLKKDITPQEVFNICMDLRTSLREFIFTKKDVLHNPLSYTNEIATIMDANLSGVLEIFTNVYRDSKLKLHKLQLQQDKLLEENQQIQDDVTIDKLTGLINYVSFEKLIKDTVQELSRDNRRLFIAIVDIPNIRAINHSKGMSYGDEIVKNLANELGILNEKYIGLGRLGGGRFGVLLEATNEQNAYNWCVELYQSISDRDEKITFCITEIDFKEAINKFFLRVYDLIDEANSDFEIIINTDFQKITPFKALPNQNEFTGEVKSGDKVESYLYYKELALNHTSIIKEVSLNALVITASKKQIKIAAVGQCIYFKLTKIGSVKANIKHIDEDLERLTLDSFRFDIHSPLDRKLYRVKASDDFRAYIRDNNRDYDVKVLDMNNNYIAIEIDRKRNFDIGASFVLYIRMIIDTLAYNFETSVSIEKIEKIVGHYKFVVQTTLDTKNEEILQEYLASFQRNIIKDFQN